LAAKTEDLRRALWR